MTLSLRCGLLFIFIGAIVNGQYNDPSNSQRSDSEKGYSFGKLRISNEGKGEELIANNNIEKPQLIRDQPTNAQPLPSPCIGTRSLVKLSHPKEKTKYIQCRDEFHYEILACPTGYAFNEETAACDISIPIPNKCEVEKPCLNDGQCTLLTNSTFKCTCRPEWTGDRCDTPMTPCVRKPCGADAECIPLKAEGYEQDYVCVCYGFRGYGLNCKEIVANPCETGNSESFYPFAFSQHAYVQCDGDLVHFQPCSKLLYWNQEEKICDRKRQSKPSAPKFITINNDDRDENLRLTTKSEQRDSYTEQRKEDNGNSYNFIPARVANRQQFEINTNTQQDQYSQQTNSNPIRQDYMSKPTQWSNQQTDTLVRSSFPTQSESSQVRGQNGQQQFIPSNTNFAQTQFRQETQNTNVRPQLNQQFTNQFNNINTQNDQRFISQTRFQDTNQNEQVFLESTTITSTISTTQPPKYMTLEEFLSSIGKTPEKRIQTQPTESNQETIQNFAARPTTFEAIKTNQNDPRFQTLETSTIAQNILRPPATFVNAPEQFAQTKPISQTFENRPQQSWQKPATFENQQPIVNRENGEFQRNFVTSEGKFLENQQVQMNKENPVSFQSGFNQQTVPTADETTPFRTNIGQTQFRQETQNTNVRPQLNQQFTNQFNNINTQNDQRFIPQTPSLAATETNQNQQIFVETTTTTTQPPKIMTLEEFLRSIGKGTEKPVETQPIESTQNLNTNFAAQPSSFENTRTNQNQQAFFQTTTTTQAPTFVNLQNDRSWQTGRFQDKEIQQRDNQIFAFQPQVPRADSTRPSQQDNNFSVYPRPIGQFQQPSTDQLSSSQYGSNQQSKPFSNQNNFEQQIITNNQQYQNQGNQNQATEPNFRPQFGSPSLNSYETTTTAPNRGVIRGFAAQDFGAWKASQQNKV